VVLRSHAAPIRIFVLSISQAVLAMPALQELWFSLSWETSTVFSVEFLRPGAVGTKHHYQPDKGMKEFDDKHRGEWRWEVFLDMEVLELELEEGESAWEVPEAIKDGWRASAGDASF